MDTLFPKMSMHVVSADRSEELVAISSLIENVSSTPIPLRDEATASYSRFLTKYNAEFELTGISTLTEKTAVCLCEVTAIIRGIAAENSKLATRQRLQTAAHYILHNSDCATTQLEVGPFFALALILAALAVTTTSENRHHSRSAASAIVSTLEDAAKTSKTVLCTPNFEVLVAAVIYMAATRDDIPSGNDKSYFATSTGNVDLHITTMLARSLNITECSTPHFSEAAAKAILHVVSLATISESSASHTESEVNESVQNSPIDIAAGLALAAQLGPWNVLQPIKLVNIALQSDQWYGAERVCHSSAYNSNEKFRAAGVEAVCALIDAAFERRSYRRADTLATTFFDRGGQSRFLDARYLHACDTISKVIQKQALPVIERQVERVDQAVMRISQCNTLCESSTAAPLDGVGTCIETARDDIRSFAIRQLEEALFVDAAYRLASIWNLNYVHDAMAVQAAIEARAQRYIQWNDVLPGHPIPILLSTPESLEIAFTKLGTSSIYGFDVEWGDDGSGAALLQLATLHDVLLIDIPALSQTLEGVEKLAHHVGTLFDSASSLVVGFSCGQDLAMLRSSHCPRSEHWLCETRAVLDLKPLVEKSSGRLGTGLSRCCEMFLLKPLDKSEQCSDWHKRPLSENQRVYAALDAYVCALIYKKHFESVDGPSAST